jgi:hypothetical protein
VKGTWFPFKDDAEKSKLDWAKYYTRKLEYNGKLKLTIWPEHCLVCYLTAPHEVHIATADYPAA